MGMKNLLINRLTHTLKGMAGLECRILDLVHLGGGYIARVNATHTFTIQVNFEHDLRGLLTVSAEKFLQNNNDKLHGCVVIIKHDHLIHLGRLGFLRAPF